LQQQHNTHHITGGNMSSKPFELRAGLLGQAEGILNHRYHSKLEKIRYLCDRNIADPKTVTWPTPPSSDEIIAEAEKLYKFVQTK
tara:strand:+ start:291 stop:545 length:255 start_codon:yes stop_codon:yes gene_type:complete